ncbi:MAG: hypothetical protein K6B74_09400 [Ruminococcus sp.]|nr:hypothetical protein [Ruminococcus sp.]
MNTFLMKNDKVGHGEDAAFVCDGFAVVCDGLGGSGEDKIMYGGEETTEAKTASSLCVLAVRDFFNEAVLADWKSYITENLSPDDRKEYLEEMTYALRHHIIDFMRKELTENGVDMETIHAIPTTLALAVFAETDDCTEVTAIWAGDSRVYTLSPMGLQQLSRDDTVSDDFDANEQIGTSSMNGCVTLTSPFRLNFLHHRLEKIPDRLVFCCSDGCFDGLKSIMMLEFILLDKLMELHDDEEPETFIDGVKAAYVLGEVYGVGLIDDTSLAGRFFGRTDSRQLKKEYLARYANLKEVREIVNEWLTQLMIIYDAAPSKETDADIFERYGDFAVKTAITALGNRPENWEEQILCVAVGSLPVFERYCERRDELVSRNEPDEIFADESKAELREEFCDAYLKLLCFSRENRDFALRKAERGLAAQLGFELDGLSRQIELINNFNEMRDDMMETLFDIKCFYDVFEDDGSEDFVQATRRDFLEALSDTLGQITHASELSYRILNSEHCMSEDEYEASRSAIIKKLIDNGIIGEGFAIWHDMGLPPFGDTYNHDRLEQLAGQVELDLSIDRAVKKELTKILKDLVNRQRDKIAEQFLKSTEIIYSSCLDCVDGIGELRDWLGLHLRADKQAEEAYEQVGKIWRFHYKSMYEQYKKAQTGGRA